MKKFKLLVLAAAVAGIASSAHAIPTLTISDGAGIATTQTNAGGVITDVAVDAFWAITITTAVSEPPAPGEPATTPFLSLTLNATSTGLPGGGPLVIQFSGDNFGPSSGLFASSISNLQLTDPALITLDTFYSPLNTIPAANPLSSIFVNGVVLNNSALASVGPLAPPYSLTETLTVTDIPGQHYDITAGLQGLQVPDGGMTVALLGLSLVGIAGLKTVRAKRMIA